MAAEELDLLYNIIGTSGVLIIVFAYLLLQTDKIDHLSFAYSFWNLFGSILIFFSLMRFWNLPSVIIEVFWIGISLYGLYRWKRNKKTKKNK